MKKFRHLSRALLTACVFQSFLAAFAAPFAGISGIHVEEVPDGSVNIAFQSDLPFRYELINLNENQVAIRLENARIVDSLVDASRQINPGIFCDSPAQKNSPIILSARVSQDPNTPDETVILEGPNLGRRLLQIQGGIAISSDPQATVISAENRPLENLPSDTISTEVLLNFLAQAEDPQSLPRLVSPKNQVRQAKPAITQKNPPSNTNTDLNPLAFLSQAAKNSPGGGMILNFGQAENIPTETIPANNAVKDNTVSEEAPDLRLTQNQPMQNQPVQDNNNGLAYSVINGNTAPGTVSEATPHTTYIDLSSGKGPVAYNALSFQEETQAGVSTWVNKALSAYKIKDWPTALSALSKAIEVNPTASALYAAKAEIYRLSAQGSNTVKCYFQALEKSEDADKQSQYSQRLLTLAQQTPDKALALDTLQQLETFAPSCTQSRADFYRVKGARLFDLGRYDEAVTTLKKATQLAPKDAHAWYLQGMAYEFQGKTQLAKQAFLRGKALSPKRRDIQAALLRVSSG
ncbi:MAG: tetratricopeptide repeat protein [Cyanobacteria bacterium]|nr:tetratricopeptide repeat protein [Cyanobacteriota bacterium]